MKLTREDSVIIIGLHRMVNDMDRRTKQICKKYDLTLGQFGVLEALNSKGDLTVGQVKDMVLSTDGTIPVITGNLEKRGYITRTQDARDKRKFILSLTDQGREIIGQVYPENNKMLTDLLSVLDKEEKKQIGSMIAKYRRHIKDSVDEGGTFDTLYLICDYLCGENVSGTSGGRMMKTLILNGSPRKHGDTASLLKVFQENMEGEVKIVNAYDCNIAACTDCRYCLTHPACVIKDEMQEIYDYVQECDNVLIASPVHFSSMSGKLLCVISRLQVYFCAKYKRKEELIAKPKKGGIILVGGASGGDATAVRAAKETMRLLRCEEVYPVITSMKTDTVPAIEDEQAVEQVAVLAKAFMTK